jgi:competence protein ComEC
VSDAAAVLIAVAVAAGAWVARPVPVAVAAVVSAAALVWRWPALLGIGLALAASGLAARSWAGLAPPTPLHVDQVVTLLGDPDDAAGALRVDVRVGRRHVEAWARGRSAARLRERLAGERVHLTGELEAVPETDRARLAVRHVSARLTIESVGGAVGSGALPSRIANRIRRTLLSGASSLAPDQRSLFAGFVLGDGRGEPPEIAYDFRASGLTHLLVVSGENVAFVLTLAGPLLRRLSLRGRLVAGVTVLFVFGTLTRWEPSVLRAIAMATISLVAATVGRPATTVRVLALAVTALLLVDPLLVHSVGFQLSVGACLGIALLAAPLAALLPGPRNVAQALAVTLAAQAGVAPVLIPTFGGLPVVALVANLLALPAAGPLMVWGLAAGLPAGVVGGRVASLVHLPTRVLLGWVASVARATAALPLGDLGLWHVAVVALGVAIAWAGRHAGPRRRRRALVAVGTVASVAVVLVPSAAFLRGDTDARAVGRGATLWRAGGASVLVLDGARGSPDRVMSSLRTAAVRRIDVLVASRPGTSEAAMAEELQRRFPASVVLGPPHSRLAEALVPPAGAELHVGRLLVHIDYDGDRLAATVSHTRSRDPPG